VRKKNPSLVVLGNPPKAGKGNGYYKRRAKCPRCKTPVRVEKRKGYKYADMKNLALGNHVSLGHCRKALAEQLKPAKDKGRNYYKIPNNWYFDIVGINPHYGHQKTPAPVIFFHLGTRHFGAAIKEDDYPKIKKIWDAVLVRKKEGKKYGDSNLGKFQSYYTNANLKTIIDVLSRAKWIRLMDMAESETFDWEPTREGYERAFKGAYGKKRRNKEKSYKLPGLRQINPACRRGNPMTEREETMLMDRLAFMNAMKNKAEMEMGDPELAMMLGAYGDALDWARTNVGTTRMDENDVDVDTALEWPGFTDNYYDDLEPVASDFQNRLIAQRGVEYEKVQNVEGERGPAAETESVRERLERASRQRAAAAAEELRQGGEPITRTEQSELANYAAVVIEQAQENFDMDPYKARRELEEIGFEFDNSGFPEVFKGTPQALDSFIQNAIDNGFASPPFEVQRIREGLLRGDRYIEGGRQAKKATTRRRRGRRPARGDRPRRRWRRRRTAEPGPRGEGPGGLLKKLLPRRPANPGSPPCPPGMTERRGHWVPATCVKSRKKKSTARATLPRPTPGALSGWKKKYSPRRRRKSLADRVRSEGYVTVVRKLVLLKNITADKGTKDAVNADLKWLKKRYRPAKPGKKTGRQYRKANPDWQIPEHLDNAEFRKALALFEEMHPGSPIELVEVDVPEGTPEYLVAYGSVPEIKYDAHKQSKKGKRIHHFAKKAKERPMLVTAPGNPDLLQLVNTTGGKNRFKAKEWIY
jgi:hypothetical protein